MRRATGDMSYLLRYLAAQSVRPVCSLPVPTYENTPEILFNTLTFNATFPYNQPTSCSPPSGIHCFFSTPFFGMSSQGNSLNDALIPLYLSELRLLKVHKNDQMLLTDQTKVSHPHIPGIWYEYLLLIFAPWHHICTRMGRFSIWVVENVCHPTTGSDRFGRALGKRDGIRVFGSSWIFVKR